MSKSSQPNPKSGGKGATQAAETPPTREFPGGARGLRFFLGTTCFLAWASVMVVEICAFRLLAPEFGNSVFTWTALIGVILVASSGGSYLGGYLADRRPALDVMGWLLGLAAVLVFLIPPLHDWMAPSVAGGGRQIAGPVLISVLLFALPAILLGGVSPAAVRFYSLSQGDARVGASAGVIGMLGSLGSFTGTFLSGFVLLAAFGVRGIFAGVAVALLLLAAASFVLAGRGWRPGAALAAGCLGAGALSLAAAPAPPPGVIHEEESFYHRIRVTESQFGGQRQRVLELDNTQEGAVNPDNGDLVMAYQHFWQLARFNDKLPLGSALFLGAGAFGMPNQVSREFPEARVDVAEIDPKVIEVGRRFFRLDEHPRVAAHAMDARQFLRSHAASGERWDLIFGDAYNGIRAIPAHLTTREFFQLARDCLTEEGVFLMNLISAVRGPRSELLAGMLATVREVFPHVEAFAVGGRREDPQNVILLCSRSDWTPMITGRYHPPGSLQARLAGARIPPHELPPAGPVFTDDFNPVDAIIARGLLIR